jgi:hypothetical protein
MVIDLSTMQKIIRLTITWTIIYVLGYQIVSVNTKLSDWEFKSWFNPFSSPFVRKLSYPGGHGWGSVARVLDTTKKKKEKEKTFHNLYWEIGSNPRSKIGKAHGPRALPRFRV